MPSRRDRLFAELGLLAEAEQPNPYQVLGIDPAFARNLLREDTSGAALRFIAGGVRQVLNRRYHPDIPKTGDSERFKSIDAAHSRIKDASGAALLRWAKTENAPAATNKKLLERQEAVANRAAELVRKNMEFGRHPQHFSQLEWTQGALLRQKASTLLLRQHAKGIEVVREQAFTVDRSYGSFNPHTVAADFHTFMKRHRSFGLEPGAKIATYIDENGRASILNPDFSFKMDITNPVVAHRGRRKRLSFHDQEQGRGLKDVWCRSADPLLLTTNVPDRGSMSGSQAEVMLFPSRLASYHNSLSAVWHLPMEAVGTFSDESFFARVRHRKSIGAMALRGGTTARSINYFSMVAIPTRQIVEQDAGYSPLMTPGNSLLLYDPVNQIPVITNTQVIGMLGSGTEA